MKFFKTKERHLIEAVKEKEQAIEKRIKEIDREKEHLANRAKELDDYEKSLYQRELRIKEEEKRIEYKLQNLVFQEQLINDLIHEQKRINERMESSLRIQRDIVRRFQDDRYLDPEAARLIVNTSLTGSALASISNLRMEMFEIGYAPEIFRRFDPEKIYPYKEIEKIYKSINGGYNKEARSFELKNNSYGYVVTKRTLPIAFFILIENAWKYTIPDEDIIITFFEKDNTLTIEIENWGPLVSPEELPMLTQRGFRGKAAKEVFGNNGKGLGLYIANEILTSCNIDLSLSSSNCEYKIYKDKKYGRFKVSMIFKKIEFN